MDSTSTLHRVVTAAMCIALAQRTAPRRCTKCGGPGHTRQGCRAPKPLLSAYALRRAVQDERRGMRDPRRVGPKAEAMTCSTHERAHLQCACPGSSSVSLADWIRNGCPLHDSPRHDKLAAARLVDTFTTRAEVPRG